MTVDEAITILCEQEEYMISFCEIPLTEARDIVELLMRLRKKFEKVSALLPDNYSESKDWQSGDITERIEWLKIMNENYKKQIEHWLLQIELRDKQIERLNKKVRAACKSME